MLKGYADVHVVFAIVQALRRRGMDVVTVQDRGHDESEDDELLAEALADERVMLTNDADFLVLAGQLGSQGNTFAPIYYWPQQGRPVGEMIGESSARLAWKITPQPVRECISFNRRGWRSRELPRGEKTLYGPPSTFHSPPPTFPSPPLPATHSSPLAGLPDRPGIR